MYDYYCIYYVIFDVHVISSPFALALVLMLYKSHWPHVQSVYDSVLCVTREYYEYHLTLCVCVCVCVGVVIM